MLVGLCVYSSAYGAQEMGHEQHVQLKKELADLDYSAGTIDLAKIDGLLESGAGLNFEESMVADIFAITQAEDTLVNDGFILRGLAGPARACALANSRAVKRRLFFGALLCRCRILARVLDRVFELLMPSFSHEYVHSHVRKIVVDYADDIFLVLPRFLITAPEAVHEDVSTLKVLFSRERDIALGACDSIPRPVDWCDIIAQDGIGELSPNFELDCVQNSGFLLQKRHARMLQIVETGSLAEFVSCFESVS